MKAMILAAGLGTRLRPLTHETPKSLIIVDGRPLIHYQIALLKKYGIVDIAINLHHLGDLIEKELGDGKKLGVRISYSREEEILGTGGGIKKMTPFFAGEDFWILNSDILIDADLKAIAAQHRKTKAKATMILRPHPAPTSEPLEPTALYINEKHEIVSTSNGSGKPQDSEPLMFTGTHIINPALLEYLPYGFSCIFQDAYRPAIEKGDAIYGYRYDGYWADLGTMEKYRETDKAITEKRIQLSYI